MRSDDEVNATVQAWDDWFQASGIPETIRETRDAPAALDEPGVSLRVVSGGWPFEIEGTVDGLAFSFYGSRGDWTVGLATTLETGRRAEPGECVYRAEGDDEDDWLKYSRAWEIVRAQVAAFRAQAVPR